MKLPCCQPDTPSNRAKYLGFIAEHEKKTGQKYSLIVNQARNLEVVPGSSVELLRTILPGLIIIENDI